MSTEQPDAPQDAIVDNVAPESTQSAPDASSDSDQRVPLDRFRAVTSENQELRQRLDALEAERLEREQAELTELERERKAREAAEKAASEAATRAQTLERSQWVTSAAVANGFSDPEDAAMLLDLTAIDSADAARAAVSDLAERKPHLVAAPAQPKAMGSPMPQSSAKVSDDPKADLGAQLFGALRQR